MIATVRRIATLLFATCGRSDQQSSATYHIIRYDTMVCKALHTTTLPATIDRWAIAI